jgi:arylsulfatase A-like enzyme
MTGSKWGKKLRVALAAGLAAGAVTATSSPAAATTPKPNIVVILADDLDVTTTPFWLAMPRTAALLRDRGLQFTQAFAPSPACCPARASLLTGQYAHNTGVYSNLGDDGGYPSFVGGGNEQRTFPITLAAAGYRTALVGKYMNNYVEQINGIAPPPGWTDWYGLINEGFYDGYSYTLNENGTLVPYGADPSDYLTDVLATKTLEFLDDAEATNDAQPFFALVSPSAPHLPIAPAPRHADHPWTAATAPRHPNFYEPDISDKPLWLQWSAAFRARWLPFVDTDYRNRMGSLIALDDLVSAVIAKLAANGELANTYLVFTSDNGYNLGAHWLSSKLVPYEPSLRIPLVVSGPNVRVGTESRMALLTDLAPTILQLAGLPPEPRHDGRSLLPLFGTAPPPTWRTDFLAEYHTSVIPGTPPAQRLLAGIIYDVPSYAAVRTDRYLFVRWYRADETNGVHEYELYDLQSDPYQLENLIRTSGGLAAHAGTVQTLHARLLALEACAGATCR